ncbi:hypothetical protein ACFFRR_001932 [Megaselia abdita]
MLENFKFFWVYFVAASLIRSSDGYGQRPVVKVIGAKTNYDSAVLPYGVLQEIFKLQRSKIRRKPIQRKTRPVTIKIYKDKDFNQYQIENTMRKKINYLGGVDNYFDFAGPQHYRDDTFYNGDNIYNGDAYSVLPYGGKEFMLVDKEGDEIADLRYLKEKGVPRITRVEPIIVGKRIQEHVFLEVKK